MEVYARDLGVAAQDPCVVSGDRRPIFEGGFVVDSAVCRFDRIRVHGGGHVKAEIGFDSCSCQGNEENKIDTS